MCSRNVWRSPTAERLFARAEGVRARSRGLSRSARRRLTDSDLAWADVVMVMEDEHLDRLLEHHREALGDTPVYVLDVPDDYRFMDPDLVAALEQCVPPLLAAHRHA